MNRSLCLMLFAWTSLAPQAVYGQAAAALDDPVAAPARAAAPARVTPAAPVAVETHAASAPTGRWREARASRGPGFGASFGHAVGGFASGAAAGALVGFAIGAPIGCELAWDAVVGGAVGCLAGVSIGTLSGLLALSPLGAALGVWGFGGADGGAGDLLAALGGSYLGAVLGAGLGLLVGQAHEATGWALGVIAGSALSTLGAATGYQLSSRGSADEDATVRSGPAFVPTLAPTEGGVVFGVAGLL